MNIFFLKGSLKEASKRGKELFIVVAYFILFAYIPLS